MFENFNVPPIPACFRSNSYLRRMKLLLHADDLGLTSGINQSILETYDRGLLNSASIIPNGYAVDEAMDEYRRRENLLLSVHLNFVEGRPLVSGAVPFLCDKEGFFNRSFASLLLMSNRLSETKRRQAIEGIRNEMKAQLLKIDSGLKPGAALRADSHQHVHMIPLFFDALVSLAAELNISYIRIPKENYFVSFRSARMFRQTTGMNAVKVALLNNLSHRALLRLPETVECNRHFMGVLFTGDMDALTVQESFRRIRNNKDHHQITEALFHPGQALPEEEHFWDRYPHLKRYYRSEKRKKENLALRSEELKKIVEAIRIS